MPNNKRKPILIVTNNGMSLYSTTSHAANTEEEDDDDDQKIPYGIMPPNKINLKNNTNAGADAYLLVKEKRITAAENGGKEPMPTPGRQFKVAVQAQRCYCKECARQDINSAVFEFPRDEWQENIALDSNMYDIKFAKQLSDRKSDAALQEFAIRTTRYTRQTSMDRVLPSSLKKNKLTCPNGHEIEKISIVRNDGPGWRLPYQFERLELNATYDDNGALHTIENNLWANCIDVDDDGTIQQNKKIIASQIDDVQNTAMPKSDRFAAGGPSKIILPMKNKAAAESKFDKVPITNIERNLANKLTKPDEIKNSIHLHRYPIKNYESRGASDEIIYNDQFFKETGFFAPTDNKPFCNTFCEGTCPYSERSQTLEHIIISAKLKLMEQEAIRRIDERAKSDPNSTEHKIINGVGGEDMLSALYSENNHAMQNYHRIDPRNISELKKMYAIALRNPVAVYEWPLRDAYVAVENNDYKNRKDGVLGTTKLEQITSFYNQALKKNISNVEVLPEKLQHALERTRSFDDYTDVIRKTAFGEDIQKTVELNGRVLTTNLVPTGKNSIYQRLFRENPYAVAAYRAAGITNDAPIDMQYKILNNLITRSENDKYSQYKYNQYIHNGIITTPSNKYGQSFMRSFIKQLKQTDENGKLVYEEEGSNNGVITARQKYNDPSGAAEKISKIWTDPNVSFEFESCIRMWSALNAANVKIVSIDELKEITQNEENTLYSEKQQIKNFLSINNNTVTDAYIQFAKTLTPDKINEYVHELNVDTMMPDIKAYYKEQESKNADKAFENTYERYEDILSKLPTETLEKYKTYIKSNDETPLINKDEVLVKDNKFIYMTTRNGKPLFDETRSIRELRDELRNVQQSMPGQNIDLTQYYPDNVKAMENDEIVVKNGNNDIFVYSIRLHKDTYDKSRTGNLLSNCVGGSSYTTETQNHEGYTFCVEKIKPEKERCGCIEITYNKDEETYTLSQAKSYGNHPMGPTLKAAVSKWLEDNSDLIVNNNEYSYNETGEDKIPKQLINHITGTVCSDKDDKAHYIALLKENENYAKTIYNYDPEKNTYDFGVDIPVYYDFRYEYNVTKGWVKDDIPTVSSLIKDTTKEKNYNNNNDFDFD